jgi:hypothetical protein
MEMMNVETIPDGANKSTKRERERLERDSMREKRVRLLRSAALAIIRGEDDQRFLPDNVFIQYSELTNYSTNLQVKSMKLEITDMDSEQKLLQVDWSNDDYDAILIGSFRRGDWEDEIISHLIR